MRVPKLASHRIFIGVLCIIGLSVVCEAKSFINVYRRVRELPLPADANVGDPLLLTPYIEKGQIKEGQAAAKVTPFTGDVESYSGYFTVNKTHNSNLFFWFFPAEHGDINAPVVLWLQGGPGASSLFGLFEEHGPYFISKSGQPKLRKHSWTKSFSMLYIDNPVGTGFSFTDSDQGYSTNQEEVGSNLYSAIYQFFQLFPQLQGNDFFVTGESYAGKYVPAAAYAIHTRNPSASLKINLKGIAIGNGLCDPENMLGHYGSYTNQLGLLDASALDTFTKVQNEGINYIKQQNWEEASNVFDKLINGDFDSHSLFYNITGFTFYFNYLHAKEFSRYGDFSAFVQLPSNRKNLHVGNQTFPDGNKVELILKQDLMKSVKPWVEELLEHYRVLIYNGQLDIIVAYPLTVGFLQALKWSSAEEYKTAGRHIWKVGDDIAGYYKTAGNLTEILVRNAGHMVPGDEPVFAYDLITRFVSNKPFSVVK